MARGRLIDRIRTPRVARAMMSPSAIVAAGAGAAVAIVSGAVLLAPLAAVAAWAARVALSVPRGTSDPRIEPSTLTEPWRGYVESARAAKGRFDRTVQSVSPGPIRDRLATLADRLDEGLLDCWQIASRGDEITRALATLDTSQAHLELAELRRTHGDDPDSAAVASTMRSLEAQLASSERMQSVARDAADRLRLLDARLDELVARAVEVSIGTTDTQWLSDEINGVVGELESLRLALDEANSADVTTATEGLPRPSEG